jgi:hypothetical protein
MPLALTSATGKLGGGVLKAILENKLIDPKELVITVCFNLHIFPTYCPNAAARHLQTRKASVLIPSAPRT